MGIVLLPFFNKRENSTPAFIRPIPFREGEDTKGFKGEGSAELVLQTVFPSPHLEFSQRKTAPGIDTFRGRLFFGRRSLLGSGLISCKKSWLIVLMEDTMSQLFYLST